METEINVLIIYTIILIVLQGHDTTAVALNFALMELANNKDIQVSIKILNNYVIFAIYSLFNDSLVLIG